MTDKPNKKDRYSATREELEPIVERMLWYLLNEAAQHGQDKANAGYMDAWVKHVKAKIKTQFVGMSNAAAEDEALRAQEYLDALKAKQEADAKDAENRFRREAALATIELYRTICSNERANV